MPYLLGVKVDAFTRAEALSHAGQLLASGGQHIITTPNPEMLVAAQADLEFREILNRAALALPDGIGLLLAGRLFGVDFPERVSGVDFVWDLAKFAAEHHYTLYLAGGKPGVAKAATENIISRLRNREIVVGWEVEPTVEKIRTARPDILFVALGHGRQEKWIAQHLKELPSVKVAMGVGGAFDFISGRIVRAPRFLRLLGLEWLWRLIRQPWRITRIYNAVIRFPFLVVKEKITSY